MDETRVWELMAKALAKEATNEELLELQEAVRAHPEWGQAYFYLQSLSVNIRDENELAAEEKRMEVKGLQRMEQLFFVDPPEKTDKIKTIHWYKKYRKIGIAASFLLLLGVTALFFLFQPHQQIQKPLAPVKNRAQTYVASQATSIELADGTKVWLNRGSTLKCDKTFDNRNRIVTLDGEAFFDVAKKEQHPFIVRLKTGISIKVLGTQFNIKAYANTPILEASLISGKIALDFNKPGKDRIVMQPHEKVTIDLNKLNTNIRISAPEENAVQKNKIQINPLDQKISETAWMDNRLSFYDMSFEELSYELERIYGVKIIFKDKKLKNYHLTGSFKDENLDQVLQALQITTPFEYKSKGDEIIFIAKP